MNTYTFAPWRTARPWTRLIAALTLAVCGSAAAGVSLSVSNHGTDSSTCGLPSSPCRSISQAIANAAPGDAIWVGAGHYGDVSGNPSFGGTGDEQPAPITTPYDRGENNYQGCI